MRVTVKTFTKHGGKPPLVQSRDFDALPVPIGRDETCTLALDDPHKHISRVHVELEEEDGTYWMSVVSKVNPVMVKGRRYGPGTRLTLKSGDSFEIGEYEIQVMLLESRAAAAPEKEGSIFEEPTFIGTAKAPAAAAGAPQEAARTAAPAPRAA